MGPPELPGGNARAATRPLRRVRLNGAAGITRRKPNVPREGRRRGGASMGPPELPGGNSRLPPASSVAPQPPQWGRRNYPAETCRGGLAIRQTASPQWGRRNYPAETSVTVEEWRRRSSASMGPPELPGGNILWGSVPAAWAALASMGPPELPGGNVEGVEAISTLDELPQWGRRNYPAETARIQVSVIQQVVGCVARA